MRHCPRRPRYRPKAPQQSLAQMRGFWRPCLRSQWCPPLSAHPPELRQTAPRTAPWTARHWAPWTAPQWVPRQARQRALPRAPTRVPTWIRRRTAEGSDRIRRSARRTARSPSVHWRPASARPIRIPPQNSAPRCFPGHRPSAGLPGPASQAVQSTSGSPARETVSSYLSSLSSSRACAPRMNSRNFFVFGSVYHKTVSKLVHFRFSISSAVRIHVRTHTNLIT